MKKKIKDLTLGECIEICNKQKSCCNCPLRNPNYFGLCYLDILKAMKDYKNIDLKREVEIY